jgi:hypothetical protein
MMDILRILAAPLLWLASFSAVYALHGLVCGHGIGGDGVGSASPPRLILASAWILAIALQATMLWALHAPRFASPSPFVAFVSRATGWTGLVAAAWSLFPTVVATSCA